MKDFAKDITFDISPRQLHRPFSYSREQRQLATLGEFLTSRFPKAALELGLLITRPQEQLPLVNELTPEEMREITLGQEFTAHPGTEVVMGGSHITRGQKIREVGANTVYGEKQIQRTRAYLEVMEEAFADGRVKRADDPVELK